MAFHQKYQTYKEAEKYDPDEGENVYIYIYQNQHKITQMIELLNKNSSY